MMKNKYANIGQGKMGTWPLKNLTKEVFEPFLLISGTSDFPCEGFKRSHPYLNIAYKVSNQTL